MLILSDDVSLTAVLMMGRYPVKIVWNREKVNRIVKKTLYRVIIDAIK